MSGGENQNVPVEEEEKAIKSAEELALLQQIPDMKTQAINAFRKLPKSVKRRTKALKNLLSKTLEMEAEYYRELHELEKKYLAKQQPFFERRREIVNGDIEPTDEDCEWESDDEEDELANQIADKVVITEEKTDGDKETDEPKEDGDKEKDTDVGPSGIPAFWLTILNNVELTQEMIQDCDIPVLEKLTDITCTLLDNTDKQGFRLEFHFAPNDYFTNTILSKEFYMRFEQATDDPLSYEGPEIVRCKGCTVNWKKDKNITVKTIKRMKKGKSGTKPVTKTVQNDSFFNFFNAEESGIDGDEELDDDSEAVLQSEFEIGQFLRERAIPRAVLYFTGEALDDEFDDEEEEEEMDEEDSDEDDEDRPRGNARSRQAQQMQQNCKQQ